MMSKAEKAKDENKVTTRPFDFALLLQDNGSRTVMDHEKRSNQFSPGKKVLLPPSSTKPKPINKGQGLLLEFVKLRTIDRSQRHSSSKQKDAFVDEALRWRYLAMKESPHNKNNSEKVLPPLLNQMMSIEIPTSFSSSSSDEDDEDDGKKKSLVKKKNDKDDEFDMAVLTGFEERVMDAVWTLNDPRGSTTEEIQKQINVEARRKRLRPIGQFQLLETLRTLMQKHVIKQCTISCKLSVSPFDRTLNLYGSKVLVTIKDKSAVTIRDTSMLIPDRFDLISESLVSLSLKDCRLRTVPSTLSSLSKLRSVALSHNFLESIPDVLFRSCVNLESVVLNNNNLRSLPSLRYLKKLRTLWISSNFLTELPDGITDLTNLQDLCVNRNMLTRLPERLENLGKSLWRLNAANNKIRTIPRSIGKLSKLRHLDLQRNEISGELPEELGELVSLVSLRLEYNSVTHLHISVGQMTALKDLCMTGNKLQGLPETVFMLTQLTELNLLENPLKEPKAGSMWKLSESTAKIAKEKIDERQARRSTIAISRDAFISASGLRAGKK